MPSCTSWSHGREDDYDIACFISLGQYHSSADYLDRQRPFVHCYSLPLPGPTKRAHLSAGESDDLVFEVPCSPACSYPQSPPIIGAMRSVDDSQTRPVFNRWLRGVIFLDSSLAFLAKLVFRKSGEDIGLAYVCFRDCGEEIRAGKSSCL